MLERTWDSSENKPTGRTRIQCRSEVEYIQEACTAPSMAGVLLWEMCSSIDVLRRSRVSNSTNARVYGCRRLTTALIIFCLHFRISGVWSAQQWGGMGMSITGEGHELRHDKGRVSKTIVTILDKFTLRLTTLSNQLESALAQYSTFPVTETELGTFSTHDALILTVYWIIWDGVVWFG